MNYSLINGDITDIDTDIIVNASNGIGYMGGILGRLISFRGVAESIHYKTKGVVEKEAKTICKNKRFKPGEIFVTGAGNLNAKYVIHAVTMYYPGMKTNIDVIKILLPRIIEEARKLKVSSIVIPLLGTGTGRVDKQKVLQLYEDYFKDISDIKVIISYIDDLKK